MKTKSILLTTAACALLSTSASANMTFNAAPPPNDVQKKYFEWENVAGGLHCKTKGKLKELVGEPNKCYLNLDECQAGKDALAGKLDKEMVQLFADMIAIDDSKDKPHFVNQCPGDGPPFLHLLAMKGLGYAQAKEHLPALLKLVDDKRIKNAGANIRGAVTDAIWHMGDKKQGIPALKRLIEFDTRNDDYKPLALQTLGRWKSDVAVEWCAETLKGSSNKKLREPCIFYLGTMKAKKHKKLLVRSFEQHPEVTARAFGLMGDKSAVKELESFLDEKDWPPQKRIPAIVALINLGKSKKYGKDLDLYLQGKKPLTKKELEKQKKEKAKIAKKKKAKQKKKAQKKFAEKWKKRTDKVDVKIAQAAAMEAVLVQSKKDGAKVNKALKAAMNKKDKKKWQAHVYATIALAQRGDKKAAKAVGKFLDDPQEKVRNSVLDAIGGRDDVPGANWMNRGQGAVADKALIKNVFDYYDNEAKKQRKTKALKAVVAIRQMSAK